MQRKFFLERQSLPVKDAAFGETDKPSYGVPFGLGLTAEGLMAERLVGKSR